MPTTKPRVMVAISDEAHAALTRFSDASGKPIGQFIAEVLDQAVPMIDALTAAALAQKHQQQEALEAALQPLQSGAFAASHELHRQVNEFTTEARKSIRKRRKKAA